MKKYFQNKTFLAGFVIVSLIVIYMFIGLIFLPYDPTATDAFNKFQKASAAHLLGTDHLGRDVFSRLIVGTRNSLLVGLCVMIFGSLIGIVLGALAGYFGKWVDAVISKLIETQMAFPGILLALMLISVLGARISITILALTIMSIPRMTRIVRGGFIKYKNSLFVKSSVAKGAGSFRIIFRHILPNVLSDVLVTANLNLSLAILSESGLSYLGLGIQPPNPSFGQMLSDGQRFIFQSPYSVLIPAIMLILMVLGFNFMGDGISEVNKH
ncbi:MAG: ABC transporter permease [Treponema sp.]|nr:ABC transporter permease [Treponema sp.]